MKTITSQLRPILDKVFTAKSLEDGVAIVTNYLNSADCRIPRAEKFRMDIRVKQCTNLKALQIYMSNSFLKYEGMGVGSRSKY